jgi:lysophospholipase L1-like esterase
MGTKVAGGGRYAALQIRLGVRSTFREILLLIARLRADPHKHDGNCGKMRQTMTAENALKAKSISPGTARWPTDRLRRPEGPSGSHLLPQQPTTADHHAYSPGNLGSVALLMSLLGRHCCAALLVLFVATASGGLAFAADILSCALFTHDGAPQPIARGDRPGLERLEQINQAVHNTPYSVLFLGDSLIEGWDPASWQRSFAPRGVLNAGISGDFTDHILWRLEHGNLAGPPPKAVILLIGTNDLAAHRSPELTADGIRANLVLLRERLPEARILLLGLLPREQSPDAPLRRAAAQVNRLIRDCADGEHIVYAEIGDVLLDSDGRLSVAISPDWLHFSEPGYARLASSLEPVLDRVLAGAPSCCQPR